MQWGIYLVTVFFCSTAFAIVGPDKLPIEDVPNSTCLLFSWNKGDSKSSTGCSATLVSPLHLVTAAHCINRHFQVAMCLHPKDRSRVFSTVRVDKTRFSPTGADIALVRVDRPIEIEPMPIITDEQAREVLLHNGETVECAHFGFGQNDLPGHQNSPTLIGRPLPTFTVDSLTYYQDQGDKGRALPGEDNWFYLSLSLPGQNWNATWNQWIDKLLGLKNTGFYILSPSVPVPGKNIKLFNSRAQYLNDDQEYWVSPIQHGDSGGTLACRAKASYRKWALFAVQDMKDDDQELGSAGLNGYSIPILKDHRKFIINGIREDGQEEANPIRLMNDRDRKNQEEFRKLTKPLPVLQDVTQRTNRQ